VREPAAPLVAIQRGCELALFQPRKVGNVDCTFCLDCVQACPYDNVGVISRVPAAELTTDPMRSGLGIFSRRKDLAALLIVFTFGALLNAFGMVSPVYALENWLARVLGINRELPILGFIFGLFLVVEPLLLIGVAAWLTRVWGGSRERLVAVAVRYSYVLVPVGFGIWLAHYGFHFLTGLYTIVPVTQAALGGQPNWGTPGLAPNVVQLFEFGFVFLGLLGSLLVGYSIAAAEKVGHSSRIFAVWAVVVVIMTLGALWLMSQPMEMRAVSLGVG